MITQMSVFIENRPGRILKITRELKEKGIDLWFATIADTKDFGILRLIAREHDRAVQVLKDAGFTVKTTELIGVGVNDEPGGLSGVLEMLDAGSVNVEYIYAHAHKSGAAVFVKVSDEAKAIGLLKEKGLKILDQSML